MPFMVRWVWGRGVPRLTAGFFYHRRRSELEVGIRQSGSLGAREAADAAAREGGNANVIKVVHMGWRWSAAAYPSLPHISAASRTRCACSFTLASAVCLVQVLIQEAIGLEGKEPHPVAIGTEQYILEKIKVNPEMKKQPAK